MTDGLPISVEDVRIDGPDRTARRPTPVWRAAGRRAEVAVGAGLRQRGANGVTVQLLDLSTNGFRAATHLVLGRRPTLASAAGPRKPSRRVVWMRGHLLGGEFIRPLHPAVLDMIVQNAGPH